MQVKTNAKINLTLDILNKRPDGYHNIDSVFQSITLFDKIEIEKAPRLTVGFIGDEIEGEKSIAFKAASAFFDYTKIKERAKITVESRIPTGSGMGGGSSDCAGILLGLNRLFDAGLSKKALCEIGSKIGADIPFCIVGGTARVSGIGEIIEPLPSIKPLNLVIIKAKDKLSTKDMYDKLDSKPYCDFKTEAMVSAVRQENKTEILNNIANAFLSVNDTFFEQKLLKDHGAVQTGLTGSGPCVFGIFPDSPSSDLAYKKLSDSGYNVYRAATTDKSVIIE